MFQRTFNSFSSQILTRTPGFQHVEYNFNKQKFDLGLLSTLNWLFLSFLFRFLVIQDEPILTLHGELDQKR